MASSSDFVCSLLLIFEFCLLFASGSQALSSGSSVNTSPSSKYYALLSGNNVVPSVSTFSSGTAYLEVDSSSSFLTVSLTLGGSSLRVSSVTICGGGAGVNGATLLTLSNSNSTNFITSYTLPGSVLTPLSTSGTYLLVSSTDFPSGEIRGQITRQDNVGHVNLYRQSLLVPSTSAGTGVLIPSADNRTLSILATFSLSSNATSVALYGPSTPGRTGSKLFDLTNTSLSSSPSTFSAVFSIPSSNLGVVTALFGRSSSVLYISAATSAFPSGECRGDVQGLYGASSVGLVAIEFSAKVSCGSYYPLLYVNSLRNLLSLPITSPIEIRGPLGICQKTISVVLDLDNIDSTQSTSLISQLKSEPFKSQFNATLGSMITSSPRTVAMNQGAAGSSSQAAKRVYIIVFTVTFGVIFIYYCIRFDCCCSSSSRTRIRSSFRRSSNTSSGNTSSRPARSDFLPTESSAQLKDSSEV